MDFTNVTKALTARGFKVSSFETAKGAAEYLNSQIDGATVGFGGSITLEELGLYALLSGHNTVFSHWHLPEGGDAATLRAQAAGSEHYLLSANGIAETGEIINIDGAGNRVASAIYGHKKVWIIVGKNKARAHLRRGALARPQHRRAEERAASPRKDALRSQG